MGPAVRLLLACALAAAIAGCGGGAGGSGREPGAISERSYGTGADQFWVLRQRDRAPRSVVVFIHGHGGPLEDTPRYHRPWLRHLAESGSAVIYPRYELAPGGHGTVAHIVRAADLAMRRLGEPRVPIIGIGYSRGARLVMDWAAVESGRRYVPRALVSVFPASGEDPEEDLSRIPLATRIVILVGDSDEVVGVLGAQALLQQLDVPQPMFRNLGAETVRSTPTFKASHLSVLETSAGARKAFWGRADRLVAYARAH